MGCSTRKWFAGKKYSTLVVYWYLPLYNGLILLLHTRFPSILIQKLQESPSYRIWEMEVAGLVRG